MLVSDIMNRNVISISPGEQTLAAAKLLSKYDIGSLPVCDEDYTVRGVVTDRDIVIRCVAAGKDPKDTPVNEIMTRRVVSVNPNASIRKAAALMSSEQIRRLPVVKDDKLIGILALGDIAKNEACDMEAAGALTEISMNIKRLNHSSDR